MREWVVHPRPRRNAACVCTGLSGGALLVGTPLKLTRYALRPARELSIQGREESLRSSLEEHLPKMKIRILHVFGRMGRGGAEMWLMNVARRLNWDKYQFDFLVHERERGEFDDELEQLGATIHIADCHRRPVAYARRVVPILRDYDVVHSHVYLFSAVVLGLARIAGVRSRIAHAHTARMEGSGLMRQVYRLGAQTAMQRFATRAVGCSAKACEAVFGKQWRHSGNVSVLHYGYDFDRFEGLDGEVRKLVRREFGIADNEFVIGHIGRFVDAKNHDFIVELTDAWARQTDRPFRFVLVGDGVRRQQIERQLTDRGLHPHVVLTGIRRDIPRMLAMFDTLILPSLWEGLPVTALEAQAVGCSATISDVVSSEVIELDNVCQRPLEIQAWVERLREVQDTSPIDRDVALSTMRATGFAIDRHLAALCAIYDDECLSGL